MGWVSRAAKLSAKALESAPKAAKEAASVAKKARKEFSHWASSPSYRKLTGRPHIPYDNPRTRGYVETADVNRAIKTAKYYKAEFPKIYQAVKDNIAKGTVGKLSGARRWITEMLESNQFGPASSLARKVGMRHLRNMVSLSKRNLLPAAAAGAGVAASSKRNQKPKGYAMGGVVPSRGQSLRTKVGNAVKGAAKGAAKAYDAVEETYWNTVLGRGALASRLNPVRSLKYAAKMVGRNPAWRRVMGVASPVADAALGAEAYYALAKDYAKKSKEGKVNPDKIKGFAYGGVVSKKRLFRGVRRKAK